MTDQELIGMAAQTANLAKRDGERGGLNFVLFVKLSPAHQAKRMEKIEKLIIDNVGEDWLDHDKQKDRGFGVLAILFSILLPEAVALATGTNMYQPTERFDAEPEAERHRIWHGGTDVHTWAVKRGLLEVKDGLGIVAQTPERVCIYNDVFDGKPPRCEVFDQGEYFGRTKFYGVEIEPHVMAAVMGVMESALAEALGGES